MISITSIILDYILSRRVYMPESEKVEGRILDIRPLVPLKITLEIKEPDGKLTKGESLFMLEQASKTFYDLSGQPAEESLQEALNQWLVQKEEDVRREVMGGLAKATPAQLKAMGIDMHNINAAPEKPQIIV